MVVPHDQLNCRWFRQRRPAVERSHCGYRKVFRERLEALRQTRLFLPGLIAPKATSRPDTTLRPSIACTDSGRLRDSLSGCGLKKCESDFRLTNRLSKLWFIVNESYL